MGCKTSKPEVSLVLALDSRYFHDSEVNCTKFLNSPVQELFSEAKKRLIKQEECIDMKLCIGSNTYIDSSSTLSLKELGVSENSQVKIGVRTNAQRLRILIQNDPPLKTSVTIQKKKTVLDLKKKLMKDCANDYILIFRNVIFPDEALITHLNVKDQEILTLARKDCKIVAIWKYKQPGFMIEGWCMNSNCQAYRQRVNIIKGYGKFDLGYELASMHECPCCSEAISKICSLGVSWSLLSAEVIRDEGKEIYKEYVEDYFQIPKEWSHCHINARHLHDDSRDSISQV